MSFQSIGRIGKIRVQGKDYIFRVGINHNRDSSLCCQFFNDPYGKTWVEVIFTYQFLIKCDDLSFSFRNIYLQGHTVPVEAVTPFVRYSINALVYKVKGNIKESSIKIDSSFEPNIIENFKIKQCNHFNNYKC